MKTESEHREELDATREILRQSQVDFDAEEAIRRDERWRVAQLLTESQDTLVGFAPTQDSQLSLVIYLLQLDREATS